MKINEINFDEQKLLKLINAKYQGWNEQVYQPHFQLEVVKQVNEDELWLKFNLCPTCPDEHKMFLTEFSHDLNQAQINDLIATNLSNYQFSDQELSLIVKANATHDCEFQRWHRKLKQLEDQVDLIATNDPNHLIAKWKADHWLNLIQCTSFAIRNEIANGTYQYQPWEQRFSQDFDFDISQVPIVRLVRCFASNTYLIVNNQKQFDAIDDLNVTNWIERDLKNYQAFLVIKDALKAQLGSNFDDKKCLEWLKSWSLEAKFLNHQGRLRALERAIKKIITGGYDLERQQKTKLVEKMLP